jgi:hypothetical protein
MRCSRPSHPKSSQADFDPLWTRRWGSYTGAASLPVKSLSQVIRITIPYPVDRFCRADGWQFDGHRRQEYVWGALADEVCFAAVCPNADRAAHCAVRSLVQIGHRLPYSSCTGSCGIGRGRSKRMAVRASSLEPIGRITRGGLRSCSVASLVDLFGRAGPTTLSRSPGQRCAVRASEGTKPINCYRADALLNFDSGPRPYLVDPGTVAGADPVTHLSRMRRTSHVARRGGHSDTGVVVVRLRRSRNGVDLAGCAASRRSEQHGIGTSQTILSSLGPLQGRTGTATAIPRVDL